MLTRRLWARRAIAAMFGAAMAAPALAADVTGKWKSEYQAPDGTAVTNDFTFEQKGEALTGSVLSSRVPGQPAAIEDGSVKGDAIAFSVTRSFDGNTIKLRYVGTVKGDEIPLKVNVSAGDQQFDFEMVAKRQK
jgi:hypothetical protein